ncbi:hypothetical protein [Nitrospira sp. Kam-Ns4a]
MSPGLARAVLVLLVLFTQACAEPLVKRAVDSTPTWLIRLDGFRDPTQAARVQYDHPVEWSDATLAEVLERVRVLGADEGATPQPLLSFGELIQIAPGIREAFYRAKPSEWVVFAVIQSKATYQTLTSGGLFVKGGKLHLMIANHRARIPPGKPDAVDPIKAVPLRPVSATPARLTFDPPEFVAAEEGDWVKDDSGKPVGQLVVDYQGFLASHQPVAAIEPARPGPSPAAPAKEAPATAAGNPPTETKPMDPQAGKAGKPSFKPKAGAPRSAARKAPAPKSQEEGAKP